jgi:DUF2950 family protein
MIMSTANTKSRKVQQFRFLELRLIISVVVFLAPVTWAESLLGAPAQEPDQRTFSSAEEASRALFAAAQQQDDGAILEILGPDGEQVISSGDPVEDMNNRVGFVAKYEEMHRCAKQPDGTIVLYVGAENRPLPIPLVCKNGRWFFDTEAGKQEILSRRMRKNELAAIDASHQLVDAEKQYYDQDLAGHHEFAQRFISDQGKHNGLFWSETTDEFASPLDPLIAYAGVENANAANDTRLWQDPIPFNGYYFRFLTGQRNTATGGANTYIEGGSMVSGFAFVVYPAEYRSSGVMTFIVGQSGVVYEKDLGPDTAKVASAMAEFDPDSTWRRVD